MQERPDPMELFNAPQDVLDCVKKRTPTREFVSRVQGEMLFRAILLHKVQTHFRSMGRALSAWTINFRSVLPTWILHHSANGISTSVM
jgi:hypothetical protein